MGITGESSSNGYLTRIDWMTVVSQARKLFVWSWVENWAINEWDKSQIHRIPIRTLKFNTNSNSHTHISSIPTAHSYISLYLRDLLANNADQGCLRLLTMNGAQLLEQLPSKLEGLFHSTAATLEQCVTQIRSLFGVWDPTLDWITHIINSPHSSCRFWLLHARQ